MCSQVFKVSAVSMASKSYQRPLKVNVGTQIYFKVRFVLEPDKLGPDASLSVFTLSFDMADEVRSDRYCFHLGFYAMDFQGYIHGDHPLSAGFQVIENTGPAVQLTARSQTKRLNYKVSNESEALLIFISFFHDSIQFRVQCRSEEKTVLTASVPAANFWKKTAGTGLLLWDLQKKPRRFFNFGDFRLLDMALWENTDKDFFEGFDSGRELAPYAFKQLPLSSLTAYYPLSFDFQNAVNLNQPLNKAVKHKQFYSMHFENDAIAFNPQAARFELALPYQQGFTCTFWMKFSTANLIWKNETLSIVPIPLWHLSGASGETAAAAFSYDEESLQPTLIITGPPSPAEPDGREHVRYPFAADTWFFFAFSYNALNNLCTLTVMNHNSDLQGFPDSVTSDLYSLFPFAPAKFYWGGSSPDNPFAEGAFTGALSFLSSVALFTGCNLHTGQYRSDDEFFKNFKPHDAAKDDPAYGIFLLHLLYRGRESSWHNLVQNYLRSGVKPVLPGGA
jgi:hypothetical protein